jgi:prophage regulatory protein
MTTAKTKKKAKKQTPRASTQHFIPAKPRSPKEPLPIASDAIAPKPVRLLDRYEVLRRVPVSYPTLWKRMRDGQFPRSRNCGGKIMWVESEVDDWILSRPVQPIEGAQDEPQAPEGVEP